MPEYRSRMQGSIKARRRDAVQATQEQRPYIPMQICRASTVARLVRGSALRCMPLPPDAPFLKANHPARTTFVYKSRQHSTRRWHGYTESEGDKKPDHVLGNSLHSTIVQDTTLIAWCIAFCPSFVLLPFLLFNTRHSYHQFTGSQLITAFKMKGFSASIPIVILAAMGQVQAQNAFQGIGKEVADPMHKAGIDKIGHEVAGPIHEAFGDHSHGGHGGSPARHQPMDHVARAFRPGEDAPSIDEGNSYVAGNPNPQAHPDDHGPAAIPTCSTLTEHVVKTITKTVTSEHKHTPTPHAAFFGGDPAAHVPQSSSTPHVPVTSGHAPHPSSSHVAMIAASTQTTATSSVAQVPATSTVAHAAMTASSSTVHAPQTYNVIPVYVPSSSHSSIKLHASGTPTPSSAYPSSADPNRFHGVYSTPAAGVSFTGAGAQLAPTTGVVTAVFGLLGLLAYAL